MTLPIETCIRRTPCIAFPEAVRLIQVSRYINAAVPPAGAGETGDNNRAILQFHIQRQKNICIFGNYHLLDLQVLSPLLSASSITMFCYVPQKPPSATFCHFCAHLCLFLLDSTWNLLRDTLKKQKKKNLARLQARFSSSHSSRQLALVAPPPKQWYPKLAQLNLLTDQFIVYLAIVVTYSYWLTTFQTEYFWSSLGNSPVSN